MKHRVLLSLLALVLSVAAASVASAEQGQEEPAGDAEAADQVPEIWNQTIDAYFADPKATAPKLLELARAGVLDLPPAHRLVLADAYLRVGQIPAAERLFNEVRDSQPGYPWDDFANLGLGAAEMSRGDPAAAEAYFAEVLSSPEKSSHDFANIARGQALIASGRPEEGKAAFDAVAEGGVVDAEFRQGAKFGSALALHAAGDYEAAAEAFEALAESDPDGPLSRDARYAAARARLEAGDREASITALQGVLADCDEEERAGRVSPALRRLDAQAVGRAWLRNYQETPWVKLQSPERTLYDIRPCRLSRSTLRELGVTDLAPPRVVPVGTGAEIETGTAEVVALQGERKAPDGRATETTSSTEAGSGGVLWVAGVAGLALLVVVWRLRSGRAS